MRTIQDSELSPEFEEIRQLIKQLGRMRPLRDPIALAVEELGFTPSQIHSILWLGTDGALTMSELAARIGITEKTITGVVDRLERADFAQRTRSETDRRVVRVTLTDKGLTLFARFDGHLRAQMNRLLKVLDPSDRQALVRILQKLVNSGTPLCASPSDPES